MTADSKQFILIKYFTLSIVFVFVLHAIIDLKLG